jgi:hypothetical protein
MSTDLQEQVLKQMRQLPERQQQQVLNYARALAELSKPIGGPGKDLLKFAGTIPAADVGRMAEAIEEGCEKVNSDNW